MLGKGMDHVYDIEDVKDIGDALVEHCYQSGLIGYHCTKEKRPGFFKETGLELTNPKKKIDAFLEEFGGRLSERDLREVEHIFTAWLNCREHMDARTGKIWFCLTKSLVIQPGTELFFKYYGGEIIYWWLIEKGLVVERLLEQIGSPVVIELALDPSKLEYFGDWNLAKSMLSYYGLSVNPSLNQYDIEGYTKYPISPKDIIEVHSKDDFFEMNK